VVASGVLNAHRRFLPPALAPLLSSAVVIATYLAFAGIFSGNPDHVASVPDRGLVVLGLGTTAGVLVLAATSLVPMLRLGLRVRPTLRFPAGAGRRARVLALAGLAGLVAQQLATLVVVLVANGQGERGALNTFNYAWAVYLLPYAVLAVPVATTAFTALSEHVGGEDHDGFLRTAALTSRAVALVSCLGAGLLVATALPVARTFAVDPPDHLAWALVAFAPGLVGYGLLAHWSRALYALGAGRAAAAGTVTGWAVAAVLMVVLGVLLPPSRTVVGIGAATSIGMTVAGVMLGRAMAQAAGRRSLAGAGRALAVGVGGAVLGGATGALLSIALPAGGFWASALEAVLVALVALAVVAGVVLALDGGDARAVLRRRFAG
jgi:putative peptidoglycan lipid II flippase